MAESNEKVNEWAEVFEEYRDALMRLAKRCIPPVLAKRVACEDAVQLAILSACSKIYFFENNQKVPVYYKLRTILLQTITDLERKHLRSQKRDAYKEVAISDALHTETDAWLSWNKLADSVSTPVSHLAKEERYKLLHQAIDSLPENDREILELRHFDGMSNSECAAVLKIEQKAASIRYVRALQRLHDKLSELSEFRS